LIRTETDSDVYDLKSKLGILKTNLKLKEREAQDLSENNKKLK